MREIFYKDNFQIFQDIHETRQAARVKIVQPIRKLFCLSLCMSECSLEAFLALCYQQKYFTYF